MRAGERPFARCGFGTANVGCSALSLAALSSASNDLTLALCAIFAFFLRRRRVRVRCTASMIDAMVDQLNAPTPNMQSAPNSHPDCANAKGRDIRPEPTMHLSVVE